MPGPPAVVLADDRMTRPFLVVPDRYVVYLAVQGGRRADLDAFAGLMIPGLSPVSDSINRPLSDDQSETTMTRTASSTLIAALALLVLLGVALAAGCTTTSSGSAGTPTPTPAGTTAVAAGTVATTVTSGSGSAAVAAVSYDRIIPFVPKTAGAWNLDGEAQGMTMKDGEGHDYTWVACDYVKPDNENAQANLAITDNGIATSPLKQQWQSFASLDTTEMSMKQVTVKGQPAWRVQEKKTNDHSMMILVGDRFMVWVQVTDGSEADLDAIVNAMDLAGLAALR